MAKTRMEPILWMVRRLASRCDLLFNGLTKVPLGSRSVVSLLGILSATIGPSRTLGHSKRQVSQCYRDSYAYDSAGGTLITAQ